MNACERNENLGTASERGPRMHACNCMDSSPVQIALLDRDPGRYFFPSLSLSLQRIGKIACTYMQLAFRRTIFRQIKSLTVLAIIYIGGMKYLRDLFSVSFPFFFNRFYNLLYLCPQQIPCQFFAPPACWFCRVCGICRKHACCPINIS